MPEKSTYTNIKMSTLGNVATYINGRAFKPSEWETEGLPIIRIQNLTNPSVPYNFSSKLLEEKYRVKQGDLLFAWSASLGAHIWTGHDAWLNQHIFRVIPSEQVKKKYLYYFLLQVVAELYAKTHGSGMVHITKAPFMNTPIPVPALNEQERIVSKIEELFSRLDASVAELQTAKEKLKVYRQAVLKEVFEGAFTHHQMIDIDLDWVSVEETMTLPTIPPEWRYIALSKLGELGRGKSKHRPRNDPALFEDGKYPFIQTGDVKAAKRYITTCAKKYGNFGLQQSKLWPKGTLCITIAANIAETAFLGIDACFPDSIVGFTPSEYIIPEYIKHFIESQKVRLWAFAPATAQKNINLDTLENLVVPYCSIEEQHQVVAEIESKMTVCDNIEETIEATLQQTEALRQSILKRAFEGEL